MERKHIYIIISVILVLVIAVGAYYAYGYYMTNKFDENFKLQYQAITNANNNLDSIDRNAGTYYSKTDFDAALNQIKDDYKKAIEYFNLAISYEQEMVKYAPNDVYRNYAEALLKVNQEVLKLTKLNEELYGLLVWPGVYTNTTRANELKNEINSTSKTIEDLNNAKDKIKLENPELSQHIDELKAQAESAITV